MNNKKYIYALYHDDEFVTLGTMKEIAEHQGCSSNTIRFYKSNVHAKRTKNGYTLIKIGEEGDEQKRWEYDK